MAIRNILARIIEKTSALLRTDVRFLIVSHSWLTLNRVVGVVTGIFLTLTFANALDPEDFGIYKYILASAGIIGAFSLTGLNTATTRAVAQGKDQIIRPIFKFGVITSIPASLLGLGASLYYFFQGNPLLGASFLAVTVSTPLLNNLGISKAILLAKEDHKTYALYNGLGAAIPVVLLVGITILTKNVLFVIIGYFLINLISGLLIYYAVLKRYNIPQSFEHPKDVAEYGTHMSVMGFFFQVANQIDQILLWHFAGPAALAAYAIALAPIREFRILLDSTFAVIFPRFARSAKEQVRERVLFRSFQMFLFCAAAAAIYVVSAPFLYQLFFPQYALSIGMSQILALSLLLLPRGIAETYLIAHGAVKIRYIITTSSLLVKIGLFAILIPVYGMTGGIIALILADLISTILLFYYYRKF